MALEEYKVYHDNGQLWVHTHYVNGNKHDEYKQYHKNGQVYIHTHYHNGKYHGEYKSYHPNGQLDWHALYINGVYQKIDIDNLTKNDKMYYTLKHGVKWL